MKFLYLALLSSVVVAQEGASPKFAKSSPKFAGAGAGASLGGGGGGGRGKATENDVLNGQCKDITFIMARTSTEPGNMGMSMGPLICGGLKRAYGDGRVACQGVGKSYTAGLQDNILPKGTTDAAIREATRMFETAETKCPKTVLVFGGYSQGTAVMHNAVGGLPAALKSKVAAGVLFGDTKNKQDGGQVPHYPKDQVTIYCREDDGVCGGRLVVTGGHFAYAGTDVPKKAVAFLKSKIDPRLGGAVPAAAESAE